MRPIGLLYDNVTPNFGDRAIGISMGEDLSGAGIPFEVVREDFVPDGKFSALVVGGGHLLRASGDRFYDRFRVPGRHILNAVGVSDDVGDITFLKNYRYISVRSSADYRRISALYPGAQIAPCSSLGMSQKSEMPIEVEDRVILVHMPPSCSGFLSRWPETVERAFPDYQKVLLSINRFNNDKEYLTDVGYYKKWCVIADLTPYQMDMLIGHPQVHGFLSTSLHGTMFALKHSKPFLALPNIEKVRTFLLDHGVSHRIWASEISPGEMRGRLEPMSLDKRLGDLWEKDKPALRSHLDRIISECRAAIAEDGRSR